jgi:putative redox protein
MKAVLRQVEGFQLVGTAETGHSVVLHSPQEEGEGWKGISPMQLVLLAAGGCTMMDIVHDLRKMRQDVEDVEVHVEADRAEEPPKVFTRVRMTYVVRGRGVRPDRVARAIQLSQEKYCSVGIMLRRAGVAVDTDFRVEET